MSWCKPDVNSRLQHFLMYRGQIRNVWNLSRLNENFVSKNPLPTEECGLFEPQKTIQIFLPDPSWSYFRLWVPDQTRKWGSFEFIRQYFRLNPNFDSFEANLTSNPIFDFEGLTQLNRDSIWAWTYIKHDKYKLPNLSQHDTLDIWWTFSFGWELSRTYVLTVSPPLAKKWVQSSVVGTSCICDVSSKDQEDGLLLQSAFTARGRSKLHEKD